MSLSVNTSVIKKELGLSLIKSPKPPDGLNIGCIFPYSSNTSFFLFYSHVIIQAEDDEKQPKNN